MAALLSILNAEGAKVRELELPERMTAIKIKPDVIHQVVVAQAAGARAGTAHTKNRSEVSGGGRKPWKQKGTGRARHGSTRSPIWVGGGVVFGPRNTRNYVQRTPAKLKALAKFMVIADYMTSGRVTVVEKFPESLKTKDYASLLKGLAVRPGKKCLVLLTEGERALRRGFINLAGVEVMAVRQLNPYDGLRFPKWIVSAEGVEELFKLVK